MFAIQLQGFVHHLRRELAGKSERQTEFSRELRAEGAGTEQPDRHIGAAAGNSLNSLSG